MQTNPPVSTGTVITTKETDPIASTGTAIQKKQTDPKQTDPKQTNLKQIDPKEADPLAYAVDVTHCSECRQKDLVIIKLQNELIAAAGNNIKCTMTNCLQSFLPLPLPLVPSTCNTLQSESVKNR